MADISKIKTLDGTEYNLKDEVARGYHDLTPIETKTYTDVIATANDNNGAGFFYLKVRPTAYNNYWHVKTRVIATVPGYANYHTDTTFDVFGYDNIVSWYACVNRIKSTSYRPIYYNSVFLTNSTGYNNSCGHWIGVNLVSSTNNTNTTYKRTLEVQLLAYEDCTVELQDSLITPTNIPNRASNTGWYTSTNTSYSNYDACNYGLKQSGDSNTTSISNLIRGGGNYIADSVLYRYQLLFSIDENTLTPLNNANNVTETTKTMLTNVEFDPFGYIYYYTTTTQVNADAAIGAGALAWAFYGIDLRFTFNCGTTLTAHKNIYLVVAPTSNGKCKIASSTPWTQTLPSSNDGNWYILLGRTYSTYQLTLYPNHPVYYHDGTGIKELLPPDVIAQNAAAVNGHTVNIDVPANAKFTDTTYESKSAASGGTAVSLVTTGEKYTWNNKSSLALGTTSSTAYRGDYGNTAYTHAVTNKGSAFSSGLYKITTNSEGHVTAATAVAKADITGLGIPGSDTNTHRPIQVNGTQILGDNTTALNLVAGENIVLTNSSGSVTIKSTGGGGGGGSVVVQNVAIPTSSWETDPNNTFAAYPYYAAIPVTGMTTDMVPEVVFGVEDSSSGNYAPVCQNAAGYVYIYATEIPSDVVTILTVAGR